MKKIVFMGTPVFATSILKQLMDDHYNVIAVVCQPDKKVGREQTMAFPPVKQLAIEYGIPVIQPIRMREEYQAILDLAPDLIVTCAYGQMLPEPLLIQPPYGCINVHASILPRLRGGAPIHKAIVYGEKETGITIMKMAKKMDAGDVFVCESTPIEIDDTMGSLHDRLMELGASMIHRHLPSILDGTATFSPQIEEHATFAYNISKEEERIDFSLSFEQIYDHIRGLIPWPVSYGWIDGKKLKIWKVKQGDVAFDDVPSGTLVGLTADGIQCKAGKGYIYLQEVQLEGKSNSMQRNL